MTSKPNSPRKVAQLTRGDANLTLADAHRKLKAARRNVEAVRQDYEDALAIARHVAKASGGDPNALLWDYRDCDSEGSK
jgi:hypothetical protein